MILGESCESNANCGAESSNDSSLRGRIVDSPEAIQTKNSASAHRISPDSWCKKSESKGAVVPPADFLLESGKRGSPPKSEKRQLFGNTIKKSWGERGGGAQPFLRENKNNNGIAESAIDSVPTAQNDNFSVRVAESSVYSANNALGDLESLLKDLKPWRKGPFNICGTLVQSEWDSAIKFNIIAPHLSVEGKVVADIGCNNGYYAFRLLPLRPSKIVGFEPSAHCKAQFDLIDSFIQSEIRFEMLGVEDLADYDCKFDCILCLGVIYHRTNPIDCLKIIRGALRARGELIIDTLIIEGEGESVLSPLSYAKMKNVYFIPSISAFKNWLVRAGFREIELLGVLKTTSDEQRKTAWSGGESLEDFLDKNDKNKTIEGYSAPIRAYFKAKI